MPKSKRNQVVSLQKVDKKTKLSKMTLMDKVKESMDQHDKCYLIQIVNFRNIFMKELRLEFSSDKYIAG